MAGRRESDIHIRIGEERALLDAYVAHAYDDPKPLRSAIMRDLLKAGLECRMAAMPKARAKTIRDAAAPAITAKAG